ncbi:terminase small subunit [Corallococcus sp. CA053C]|nr:terminase small subunit [Corallococcus sp. CA053C]
MTPKQEQEQEQFVREYLVDLNATRVARSAGYSARTAEAQGSRLLTNVKACSRCGGRWRVQASLTAPRRGVRHSGVPGIALAACSVRPSAGATPERGVLSPKHPHSLGSPRVTLQRPFSTPLHQPAPQTGPHSA